MALLLRLTMIAETSILRCYRLPQRPVSGCIELLRSSTSLERKNTWLLKSPAVTVYHINSALSFHLHFPLSVSSTMLQRSRLFNADGQPVQATPDHTPKKPLA